MNTTRSSSSASRSLPIKSLIDDNITVDVRRRYCRFPPTSRREPILAFKGDLEDRITRRGARQLTMETIVAAVAAPSFRNKGRAEGRVPNTPTARPCAPQARSRETFRYLIGRGTQLRHSTPVARIIDCDSVSSSLISSRPGDARPRNESPIGCYGKRRD
jgi:hypothetical protein